MLRIRDLHLSGETVQLIDSWYWLKLMGVYTYTKQVLK